MDSTSLETGWTDAPRWVHDAGAKLAHLANRRFRDDRAKRLDEISRIEDKRHEWAANPPRTQHQHKTLARDERRYARLTRPHRRTLEHRSRKNGTQTLEVDNNQAFRVSQDRMSINLTGKYGFRVPLRRPLPPAREWEVRSFRLVELRKNRRGIANRKLCSIQYEAHISVQRPAGYAGHAPEVPFENAFLAGVVGVDAGVVIHWATSDGDEYHHTEPERFKKAPRRLQTKAVHKRGGSSRPPGKVSKRRRKVENRRKELLRRRTAERDRFYHESAIDVLDRRLTPVQVVAIENLNHVGMRASAKGGDSAHGRNVKAKAGLNRSMSEAGLSRGQVILRQQAAKRGICVFGVQARNTSRTCSRCNETSNQSRKNQAGFECVYCWFACNADVNAAVNIQKRAYVRHVNPDAVLYETAKNGREELASGPVQLPLAAVVGARPIEPRKNGARQKPGRGTSGGRSRADAR